MTPNLSNITRNWKTSLAGLASLLTGISQVVMDTNNLNKPDVITMIIAGLGLLFAKDGDKSGTITNPK